MKVGMVTFEDNATLLSPIEGVSSGWGLAAKLALVDKIVPGGSSQATYTLQPAAATAAGGRHDYTATIPASFWQKGDVRVRAFVRAKEGVTWSEPGEPIDVGPENKFYVPNFSVGKEILVRTLETEVEG